MVLFDGKNVDYVEWENVRDYEVKMTCVFVVRCLGLWKDGDESHGSTPFILAT